MKITKWRCIPALLRAWGSAVLAQTDTAELAGNSAATLDALREKHALQIFLKSVEQQIVSAADAMPATKYGYAPTEGEFKGVRTFGQQVKHLAATNHILAAAALGEDPPAEGRGWTGNGTNHFSFCSCRPGFASAATAPPRSDCAPLRFQ